MVGRQPAIRSDPPHPEQERAEDPGKAEVTRLNILDAAARIFRRDGYASARLTDIAGEIGMKAGSLYYHFGSREALVEAVMEAGAVRAHANLAARLAALPADTDPLKRLEAAIEAHLLTVLAHEDVSSAVVKLIWQVPAPLRERVIDEQRAYGALWRDLLSRARDVGAIRSDLDLSVVRMAILGALNWASDWYAPGRMSPSQIARDICAMVIGGLAASPRPVARV